MSRRPVVGAVITAFDADRTLLTSIDSLNGQVDLVVVVNDSPHLGGKDDQAVLIAAEQRGAVVVDQPANLGIAAALNAGLARLDAQLPGWDAVLTCDQDSVLPPGYVDVLLETWRQGLARGIRVGMVAPSAAGNIGRLPGTAGAGTRDGVRIGGEPIQSGLLIPRATWRRVGDFDEGLFIDGVDSDFWLRTQDAGAHAVVAPIAIEHQLGRSVPVRLGPLRLDLTVAADHRYYYRVRNLVLVGKRHLRRHPGWVLRAWSKELRHEAITGLLVPGRRARTGQALLGLVDGLKGIRGRKQK